MWLMSSNYKSFLFLSICHNKVISIQAPYFGCLLFTSLFGVQLSLLSICVIFIGLYTGKSVDITLHWAVTTSFHILSNSLFTDHHVSWHYVLLP